MEFKNEPSALVSELYLPQARLNVHLGCSDEEKAVPQEVDLSLRIRFQEPPPGCQTDELKDTICYAQHVSTLRSYLFEKRFSLIESLAQDVFEFFKDRFPKNTKIAIEIHKLYPPVEKMPSGVVFKLGEFS